jgi:hypothetical protein
MVGVTQGTREILGGDIWYPVQDQCGVFSGSRCDHILFVKLKTEVRQLQLVQIYSMSRSRDSNLFNTHK